MLTIDVLNPIQRKQLASGFSRMLVEPQLARPDHCVRSDGLGSVEISLERRILDKLDAADVRKPLASHRVADKVLVQIQIEAGQVLQRVGKFGARQSPNDDLAGIAGISPGCVSD